MQTLAHYEQLAALLDYPGKDYPGQVRKACRLLGSRYPLAAAELDAFARGLLSEGDVFSGEELNEVQEIFTRSF
ncbi:MAG: hypothetical protein IID06_11830, partial [Gemmatimonadetes bacterium]|nr:hypothetical protein [Gemmatimonadota bacterium]